MKTDAPKLTLVPQPADAIVVRAALRELHDLAMDEHEAPTVRPSQNRRWHPSMGAPLAAVR
jgi:hypothetical protein